MKIIDITRPLSDSTLVYPGDIRPSFQLTESDGYVTGEIRLGTHTGTHIDAPFHCISTGIAVDGIPLSSLVGTCRVLDMSSAGDTITPSDLDHHLSGACRVLLKTAFSTTDVFRERYPSLGPDAAAMVSTQGLRCIGTDAPSIEPHGSDGSVHRKLLSSGCIIIELLDLSEVRSGDYWMAALPLRLKGLDASPARVILIDRERT